MTDCTPTPPRPDMHQMDPHDEWVGPQNARAVTGMRARLAAQHAEMVALRRRTRWLVGIVACVFVVALFALMVTAVEVRL